MYLRSLLTITSLVLNVSASVLNVNIYTDSDTNEVDTQHGQVVLKEDDQPEKGAWRYRDDDNLVSLSPNVRSGVLDPAVEEGLIYALGPRFVNELAEAAAEQLLNASAVASCNPLKCLSTLVPAAPCIAAAIGCKCAKPLLACPIGIKNLCSCIGCLPKIIQEILGKIGICSGSFDEIDPPRSNTEPPPGLNYPDFITLSRQDNRLLAYRGDISGASLTEAKSLAADGFCPGTSCGSCGCCLGLCAFGQCVGACVSLPGLEDGASSHYEL